MNIVLVSQWFPPEQAPIGYMMRELAGALAARGHDVTVITGFPNHPGGVVFGGYKKQWLLNEMDDRFAVKRVWSFTRRNPGKSSRILGFLSFTISSALALLAQSRVDLIFAVFQPLSIGITLPLLAKLKGAKLILNVQDLHPDVPIELGLIRNPVLIGLLRGVERLGYRTADGLAVICEAFEKHCIAKGPPKAVAIIPNWIDADEVRPGKRQNDFRSEMGISEENIVVLYAGTIGMVSGAEVVLRSAVQIQREQPKIRFVFVGEGPALPELKEEVARLGLCNVLFAPFQPRERLSEVQAMADISLVTLRQGKGRTSVPSKVLGYMAAARPVIAAVDGDSETALLIGRSRCGTQVQPGDAVALAKAISTFAANGELRCQLGSNGRQYLEEHYKKETVTDQYVRFFEEVVGQKCGF